MDRELRDYCRKVFRRARSPFWRRGPLAAELLDHIQARYAELIDRGLTREQAARIVLEEFGRPDQLAQEIRSWPDVPSERWYRHPLALALTGLAGTLLVLLAYPFAPFPDAGGTSTVESLNATPLTHRPVEAGPLSPRSPLKENPMRYAGLSSPAMAFLSAALLAPALHADTVPAMINHQGVVTVNSVRYTGTGYFRFALVNTGGQNVWTNDGTQLNTSGIPTATVSIGVVDGIYSVRLGDTALANMVALDPADFNDHTLRLRVWFDDGTHGNQWLSPDHPLTAAPYAFSVPDGSITPAKLATGNGVWSKNGNDLYYNTGNVGIGTDTPTAMLHLAKEGDTSIRFETANAYGSGTPVLAGPASPGTLSSNPAGGSLAWTNPGYAAAGDNAYATAGPTGSTVNTQYLLASNLGFNLPGGATITGIEVAIERQGNGGSPATATFNYTGAAQSWTVPSGITSVTVDVRGASGSALGGRVQATLAVTPGEQLGIYVGGQGSVQSASTGGAGGYNGGGTGGNGSGGNPGGIGGGGASDIRQGGSGLNNRIVVAGGGGGSGCGGCSAGGTGGGTVGGDGVGYNGSGGGGGGTQSAGGTGGGGVASGAAGALGQGGAGGSGGGGVYGGGGGGGGYYGGGGGGVASGGSGAAAGGGGSSLIPIGGTTTSGFQSGHGQVIISYTPPAVLDNRVSLVKAGTVQSANYASSTPWPASDSTTFYGGSTDLWGTTWTAADINNPNFGIALSAGVGAGATASVDHLTVKVHYIATGTADWTIGGDQSDVGKFKVARGGALGTSDSLTIDPVGNVGIGLSSPSFPLHLASGAHVTAGGVWTNASSRDAKENIRPLDVEEAITTLRGLHPMRYNYKTDRSEECLGFIAEDVPELVATRDRKSLSPMDIATLLTRVVQQQQAVIEQQRAGLDILRHQVQQMQSEIDALRRTHPPAP